MIVLGVALILIVYRLNTESQNATDPAGGNELLLFVAQYPVPFIGVGLYLIATSLLTALRQGTRVDEAGIRLSYRLRPSVPWSRIDSIREAAVPFGPRRYVIVANEGRNVRFNSTLFLDPRQFVQALRTFAPSHVDLIPPIGAPPPPEG